MPTTLTNGIQLPDKGSVDWYSSMQSNYNLIDTHLGDTDVHVTAEDKANWNSKQGSLSQDQLDAIAQVATNTDDIATLQSGKADASHTHSSSDITDIDDYATKDYVDNSISGLVDNAPDALNTLNELSAALNDDSNFASTVTTALAAKADSADLATVATSGSYNDLDDLPTIPTNTSDLTNDSDFVVSSNLATVATSGDYDDLDNKPSIPTNTSDLNNDSGFVTLNDFDIPSKTSDLTNDSGFITSSDVPTSTSDLINDSNFVDTSNPAVSSGITSAKVTDYDAHIADTDIHVTTADKNRWNNQTYVFRYSSTALVASSTNSNTLLDNTDNLKVGDKVIDSSGVLFSITAIDTQNSTFTIGTALIDLAQDSDVVHKSGNETVGGVKSFSDNTYIKSLNFTSEVPSPSSSNSSIMPIITTITYGDSSPSQSARLNFRISADGTKSLYPHENNQYALGLQSRKWSEVRAIQYYYGSSDTEFSDKFITTDTAQNVTANKNFKGLITTTPDSPLWTVNTNTTADITSLASTCIHVESKPAGTLTDLSGGAWYVAQIGTGCFFFRQNKGTDIRYKHFPTNVVSKICVMSNDNKFISDLIPDTTNTYKLGDSNFKWATINGLNPSSLGMPDLSNGIDISSYIPALDNGNTQGSYTPSVNGFIVFRGVAGTGGCSIVQGNMGNNASYITDPQTSNKIVNNFIPVIKDVPVVITAKGLTSIELIYFYPCQGNV